MSPGCTVVWMPGGVRTEVHLGGKETNGAFCLLVDHPPAGWSLPSHRHHGVAETIHIVAGMFEMIVDGEHCQMKAGETIHVPADVVHSGGNVGSSVGQRVVLFSPAGMEHFFLEVGQPSADEQTDMRVAVAAAIRHGWEFAVNSS